MNSRHILLKDGRSHPSWFVWLVIKPPVPRCLLLEATRDFILADEQFFAPICITAKTEGDTEFISLQPTHLFRCKATVRGCTFNIISFCTGVIRCNIISTYNANKPVSSKLNLSLGLVKFKRTFRTRSCSAVTAAMSTDAASPSLLRSLMPWALQNDATQAPPFSLAFSGTLRAPSFGNNWQLHLVWSFLTLSTGHLLTKTTTLG